MPASETEGGAVEGYAAFTPFEESYAFEAQPSTLTALAEAPAPPAATPFVSEYDGEAHAPEAEELEALLFELYDEELDELLGELAEEAWSAANERTEQFGETGDHEATEQFLQEWVAPVRQHAEALLEDVAREAAELDLTALGEAEVDELFDRHEPRDTGLAPYFEGFLGGLVKKARTLVKKAVGVARKGLSALPGIAGMIRKLKALVKPLLDRVLKVGIDRLPPRLRPLARQLAARLLPAPAGPAVLEAPSAAPTAPDAADLQKQFDLEAASLLFASDETEQELVVTTARHEAERGDGPELAELHEARTRFVDELEAGVDPEQALENFIPAVMAVLPVARTVIGVIGRNRVVSFLAGLLARLIEPYVPKQASAQLSRAIVDAGLRSLSLETADPADTSRLAQEAIGGAVEDAVRRVAELDEATFEHPAVLEAAATEAFHAAASENFPPDVLVPELHEAPEGGAWVALPRGRRPKHYRKYTRVVDVEITPQVAESLTTFGGTKLAAFLKDQLGAAAPLRARIHVYQAIHGTTAARIARHERGVPGLGTVGRDAVAQLHPLTVAAAGALLGQPKLGRSVPGEFRSSRSRLAAGQRLYHIEVPGVRPLARPGARPALRRASEVNVTLDFPRDEFRVFLYLSEGDSQQLAASLRRRDAAAAGVLARRIYGPGVATALGGDLHGRVKVLAEALPQDQLLGRTVKRLPEEVRTRLVKRVTAWVGRAVADHLAASADELVAATEDPADGVTVAVTIARPPGAPVLRRLLRGGGVGREALGGLDSLFAGQPTLSVRTVPGFRLG